MSDGVEPEWDLISQIGADLGDAAPDGWERLTITVAALGEELIVWARAETPSGPSHFTLGNVAINGLRLLRERMYKPGSGTWYEATILVTPDHKIQMAWSHDELPPNAARVPPELLTEMLLTDHARFPRDQDHLPAWHPAKVETEKALLVRYQLANVEDRWFDEQTARALADEGHSIRVFGSDARSVDGANTSGWVITFGPGAHHVDFMDSHGNQTKHVVYVPRGEMLWCAVVAEFTYPNQDRYWPDDDDLIGVYIGEADPATDYVRVITANGNRDPGVARDYTGFREQPFWQKKPEFGDWMPLVEAARTASPAAGVDHFDQRDGDVPSPSASSVTYSDATTGQPLSDVAARSRYDAGQRLQISISPINDHTPGRVAILWAGRRDGGTVRFHDEHGTEWRDHVFHGADGRLWLAVEIDSIHADTYHHWERSDVLFEITRAAIPGTGVEMVSFITNPTENRVDGAPPQFEFEGPVDARRWLDIPRFGDWAKLIDPRRPRDNHASCALAQRAARLRAERGQ